MGTTLTGTTPQDTYDSLIKVTDNGPLSSTVKYLTDGLGNDSALAVSTARVGIGTTSNYSFNDDAKLAVANTSGNSTISIVSSTTGTGYLAFADGTSGTDRYTGSINYNHSTNAMTLHTNAGNERMIITSAGNVGIGTSSPSTTLHLDATGGATIRLQRTSASSNRFDVGTDGTNMEFNVRDTGSFTFGGSSSYLRLLSGTGGIQFNGDTAAANALDDYEEGTWTMGISFGGASVGVTYSVNTGTYTKIGRQVTVNGYLALTSKGSSTGDAQLTGLPFTIANTAANYSVPTLWLDDITFANVYSGYSVVGDTKVDFYEFTEAGAISSLTNADFANNSRVMISFTYFV